MTSRQVSRLATFGPHSFVGRAALEQLQSAVVLHVDAALSVLRSDLATLARGRCALCGHRHMRPFNRVRTLRGIPTFCTYGWWPSLVLLPSRLLGYLRHGYD